jgi:sodium/pantothenate symporter
MRSTESTLVIGYIALCIAIGFFASRRALKSGDNYWVANRSIGTFINSWAIMAALASGGSIIGIIGLTFRYGMPYAFSMFAGAVVGFPLASILVAKQLRNLGKYTVTDFLLYRFNNRVIEIIVPIIIIISFTAYIVAQLKAAGLAAVYILGISYPQAIALMSLVFIIYVSIGGMWAVTWTDVLQGILMAFVVLILSATLLYKFNGLTPLIKKGVSVYPVLGKMAAMPVSSFIGAFVIWATAIAVIPHIVMRVYSAKDVRSARLSLNYAMIIYAIMIILAVSTIAPASRVLFPHLKDADAAFFNIIERHFSPLLAGLSIAAVMAAVMSTTDALLLACSSAISHDLYEKSLGKKASEKQLKYIRIGSVWFIGFIAMILAFNPPKLLTMLYTAAVGILCSSLFVPLVFGIWWKRATNAGALWSMLAGSISYIMLLFFTNMPALSHIIISLPFSLLIMIIASYLTHSPDNQIISLMEELHRK